jgi:porin
MDFVRDSRVAAGGAATTQNPNEVMMEVNYGAQVTPWLRVTPNLQYIINPDNLPEPNLKSNIPDTFVVGLKFVVGIPELLGLPTKNYNH